ncbi:MAG: hypothetical protein AAF654_05125 [Myxococcota bacterium]
MWRAFTEAPGSVRVVLTATTLVLLVFTFTKHRVGANVLSRFITVERLVDAGSFSHEGSRFPGSVDAVMVDGKIYSSKPPTFTLALALTTWPVRWLTGASVFEHQRAYLHYLVLVHQVLPYLFVLLMSWRWLVDRGESPWVQSVTLITLSFACLPYGYAVTLNNHTPTAILLFLMWWLSDRIMSGRSSGAASALTVGLLGGLAASYELTAGIFTPLFGIVLATQAFRYGLWVALGAIVASIPMFAIYYGISGSVVPFYLQRDLYDFPGGYWRNPTGMDALDDPLWLYAFNALFGHHGLFALSPIVLFGWAGLAWNAKGRDLLSAAVLLGACIVIGYIVTTTNNYGGRTLGMRWFTQFAPLFALGAVPVYRWLEVRSWGRRVVYLCLAISAAAVIEALIQNAFSPGGWVYGLQRIL